MSYFAHFAPLTNNEGACHFASDELGLYLHTDSIFSSEHTKPDSAYFIDNVITLFQEDTVNAYGFSVFLDYAVEPQITLDTLLTEGMGWYLVKDTIYADEPYEFMVWGQFRPNYEIQWIVEPCVWNAQYAMHYVDDVTVHLLEEEHIEANAGVNSTICLGDSIQIGTSDYEDYMYWWSPNEEMITSDFGGVNPGMPWVKPTATTTYSLIQKDFGFIETTDQITITVEECIGINEYEILAETIIVSPNPASNFVTIKSKYEITSWKLLNGIGREVLSSKVKVENTFSVNTSSFDVGVYYLELIINNQRIVKDLLLINQE